ncbi:phage tail tape measure protein [Bordetella sp. 2513F-2]
MDKNLQLRIIAAMQDKLSAPLSRIRGRSVASARSMSDLRDRLKALSATQRDVGRFTELARGLQATRSELSSAQQRVAELARQMQATTAPTQAMRRKFDVAVRSAQQLKARHGEQARELQQLRSRLHDAGISTGKLVQHERDLRQRILQTNQALNQQAARLKATAAQQQRLASAKERMDRMRGAAGSMAGTGVAATAAGGAGLYTAARFLAPGLDFDVSMSRVQALARLEKDSPEAQMLRAQARQLGASTQFTAGQAADAQGFLAMAGFRPDAIQAAMPGMLSLAKAGDTDLAQTADIGSNILTGFNLQASEMGRVGDVLVGAFTRSNTSLYLLGETMKYVAPVAAGVGQDIETMAAMAGKLGDAGIQGSMGGTALRAIVSRLAAPPKMAADALAELNIQTKDAAGNLRDLPTILREIHRRTQNMGTAQRSGLFKAIAGEEAFSGLQVLVNQAGSGELQKFVATLRQSAGEADRTAAKMADNLRGDLDAMSSAWEDFGIGIEEQEDGALRRLVQGITGAIGHIARWTQANPQLTSSIFRVGAVLAAVVAIMGTLTLALASLVGPFAIFQYGMTLLGARAPIAGRALGVLASAIRLVGTVVVWLGRALLTNPLALAITAIGLAAYSIYRYWGPIKGFFSTLWDSVKQVFSGGLGGIVALLADWSPLGVVYRGISAGLSALGIELPAKFSDFGSMLMQGLINGVVSMAGAVRETISNMGGSVVSWFKDKLGIQSPSRVMMEMGGYVAEGAALGITRQQPTAVKAAQALAASVALSAGPVAAADTPPDRLFDTRTAVATAPAAQPPVSIQGDTITLHISVASGNPQDIARAVEDALRRRDAEKGARLRSALRDID